MVQVIPDEDTFEKEILNNSRVIREAFERADIEMIRALHHPEVVKALGDNDIKNGREEVIDTLKGTLGKFYLFFFAISRTVVGICHILGMLNYLSE